LKLYRILVVVGAAAALQGCLAKAAFDVATLPVRAAGKAVDLATTSQSEADEKRGRALRKREEELGKLERSHAKHARACENGAKEACAIARREVEAMERLRPSIPLEPR
jgi:hypothetical protein